MRYYTVDIALFGDALESQMPACWQAWRIVTGVQPPHMPDEPCIVRVKYSEDEDGFCVGSTEFWMGERRIYGNRRDIEAECQRFLNDRPEWAWKVGSFCPLHQGTVAALKACESELPRNQHCKVIITAVPVKGGL